MTQNQQDHQQDHQPQLPEAPASINFTFYLRGYRTQLTLRDMSGTVLLKKFTSALDTLIKLGATPTPQPAPKPAPAPTSPQAAPPEPPPAAQAQATTTPQAAALAQVLSLAQQQAAPTDPSFCPVHQVPMTLRGKNGDQWYSHKSPEGTWCRGA